MVAGPNATCPAQQLIVQTHFGVITAEVMIGFRHGSQLTKDLTKLRNHGPFGKYEFNSERTVVRLPAPAMRCRNGW